MCFVWPSPGALGQSQSGAVALLLKLGMEVAGVNSLFDYDNSAKVDFVISL